MSIRDKGTLAGYLVTMKSLYQNLVIEIFFNLEKSKITSHPSVVLELVIPELVEYNCSCGNPRASVEVQEETCTFNRLQRNFLNRPQRQTFSELKDTELKI